MTEAEVVFTIALRPDRTSIRTEAAPGGDPTRLLRRAIKALEQELSDVKSCPYHRAARKGTSHD